ncbi:uncharacterized protein LOC132583383 [Heteronotia binoei]|uniref:uncharacterized protein LOC132583383 n=1 Tax=Heteronotia binoei TaxID=13085 RepID=UPI00292F0536|nr:uncharacterized protein LOC132583383 [Heteronotia binoei]
MALDVVDADVLKRNIVHLLLKHPQGIKYGDFSGAFYKLHGHHPQLALHGYGSLKCLLTDMKNMVVLENNSETTVIKLANGIPFDPWLDEGDEWDNFEEGWDSSEEEIQSLKDDDDEDDDEADPCGPAASLDTDFSACNLVPQKMGRKEAVLTAALVPILSILQDYPKGLNLPILTEALKKRGFDLEHFSQDMGYGDIIHCLLDVPGLHLIFFNDMSAHNCVIQLLSSSSGLPALPLSTGSSLHKPLSSSATDSFPQQLIEAKPASRSSAASQATASLSCDLDCSAIKSKTLNQNELGKKPEGLTAPKEVLVSLSNLLNTYLMGLRVKKLQELLLSITGFDLEKFSIAQGYKDTLEFLEHQMPKLKIRYDENRQNSVVKQGKKKKRKKSQNFQEKMTKTPAEVLTLLPNLLSSYPEGLRVKKLQTFLLSVTGFDLEKFSIAQGYKDTLEFLGHQMPELKIRYDENRHNCVVMQGKKKKQKKSQDFQKKMTKCKLIMGNMDYVQPNVT